MSSLLNAIALVSALILINERITEFVYKPLIRDVVALAKRPPELASKVTPYIAALSAGLIVVGFNADVFKAWAIIMGLSVAPPAWITLSLTVLVVSGGSTLFHDLFAKLVGRLPSQVPAPSQQPAQVTAQAVAPLGVGPLGVAEAMPQVVTEGQGQQVAARQDSDQWLMVTALAMAARLGQGSAENGLKQMVIYHYRHQAGGGQ